MDNHPTIILENDHVRGNPFARLTLVEYGDYHCPFTVAAQRAIDEILARYADEICFVFRPLPLIIHPEAELAARAAEASALQNRFWDVHRYLFEPSGCFDKERIMNLIRDAGLDPVLFEADWLSPQVGRILGRKVALAQALGVDEAPTFYLNGKRLRKPPTLEQVSKELRSKLYDAAS